MKRVKKKADRNKSTRLQVFLFKTLEEQLRTLLFAFMFPVSKHLEYCPSLTRFASSNRGFARRNDEANRRLVSPNAEHFGGANLGVQLP